MNKVIVPLIKQQFSEKEKLVAEFGGLKASSFVFDSGVHALRISGQQTELVLLPFQGQQIWQAVVKGRDITMKSMFEQPYATTDFLRTYGAFFLHCGATAMGGPSAEDTHALHGELPNAPYQRAFLLLGEDDKGRYLGMGGEYQHTEAFSHNYLAQPLVKVYEDSSIFSSEMVIKNLKNVDMELMYLAHINFRPEDNAEIIYSAKSDAEHVRVRQNLPAHITPKAGYQAFLDELAQHPEKHHVLKPELNFDPEVVFFVDYLADASGWAHSLLKHTDGTGSYMRHRPEQLGHGVRWISRTPDQDALGIADPATAEPDGYSAEKAKGNIKVLPAGGTWRMKVEMGVLSAQETNDMHTHIKNIVSS